tara:strand:- start:60 stop:461 length:402 start_codon:yes stop_codon:yes gene_type:complete
MRGKKGFIRILEAFIAILIISGAMTFLYVSQVREPNAEESLHELQRIILEEISSNNTLREDVLNENLDPINNTIKEFIPSEYLYDFKICNINEVCKLDVVVDKEVFSEEITVSSTLETFNTVKLVKLFMWEKD